MLLPPVRGKRLGFTPKEAQRRLAKSALSRVPRIGDKWTITIQKEHKKQDTDLASLGQNGSQKSWDKKTTGQVSRTLQPPNQRQHAINIGWNNSRGPNAIDVDRASITITDEEIQRYRSKVICSVCFGRRYIYDTCCPPTPKIMQGGSTSTSTKDVMDDKNDASGNEDDDSHSQVSKTDPSPTNKDGEAKEFNGDCKKLECYSSAGPSGVQGFSEAKSTWVLRRV